MALVPHVT
jgi:hypothetical protein